MKRNIVSILILSLVFAFFAAGCSSPYKEVKQDNGDIWIYPNSLHYDSERFEFSIDFPESWKNNVLIVEYEESAGIFLREAKENEPELNVGTVLFWVISVDKADEGRKTWAEAVNGKYFGESSNKTIYLDIQGEMIASLADMPQIIKNPEVYSDMGVVFHEERDNDPELYARMREEFDKAVKEMITLDNGK